jgi:hypothetical protein
MIFDDWYPVTRDMGLIQAPVEAVVAGLSSWHASIGITYRERAVTDWWEAALSALPPLSAEKRRRLFVATESGWTACFQSGIDGSDPFPAMSFLAEKLGVLAMRVCSSPVGAQWPANVWEVYAPPALGGVPPLHYRRSVCAMNDGGRWVFEQSGEPFDFEDRSRYSATRKRDRFDRDLLTQYLEHFGLRPFSDSFYLVSPESPAVILEAKQRWEAAVPEFTLAEVKAGKPWARP